MVHFKVVLGLTLLSLFKDITNLLDFVIGSTGLALFLSRLLFRNSRLLRGE